ncbi:hypothetical protein [Streptomyces sp. URMC 129]|uniref:hypothetical protein n=1 Tax=Streptomyces sp. URMC 129 TaxID=3423407 RepID=UPI003F198B5E
MASNPSRWWQPALESGPETALALEQAAGQQQRFADIDALSARLLATGLAGRPIATIVPGRGRHTPDTGKVTALSRDEEVFCAGIFGSRSSSDAARGTCRRNSR